ncbi:MAG: hypothetical protein U0531_04175 [Dehalococcoidia bacterium]
MTAAEHYAACIDAVADQRARLRGTDEDAERWTAATARRFRFDPRRRLDPNLVIIAEYLRADDVFVDVGGGAGRVALPLALHCREAVVVDPAWAMQDEFDGAVAEAAITNARFVRAGWMDDHDVTGDVVFAANVTYFIREIVPFIDKMDRAASRRVMITVWSIPPAVQDAALFRIVHGEEQAPVPGHGELLPVLWSMGLLPDVRMLPNPLREGAMPRTHAEAVDWALLRLREQARPEARAIIEDRFGDLFARVGDEFRPMWRPDARELLITWPAGQRW